MYEKSIIYKFQPKPQKRLAIKTVCVIINLKKLSRKDMVKMSNIKCSLRDLESLTNSQVSEFGYSLLEGVMGEITDLATGETPKMKDHTITFNDKALATCTSVEKCGLHIDIFSDLCTVSYDLGSKKKVDNIIIRCFFNESTNYSIAEFELYAADSREELYNEGNKITHVKGIDSWHQGDRNNADWLFDVEGSFRYFGIKVLKANATDDITRLGFVGVYNNEYTENIRYSKSNFPANILEGCEPKSVTSGGLQEPVEIKGEETFNFTLEEPRSVSDIWLITSAECEIFTTPAASCTVCKKDNYEYRLEVANPQCVKDISVKIKGNTKLYLLGAAAKKATAKVDFSETITEDFYGLGVNVLPMSLMPESVAHGYNEAYWRLEETRILKTRPHVARMWFQPDWLVETYEEYKSGNYNFDAPKMYSVYKFLDAFKAAGTEIEFNFGWKVSRNAQSWFSFEGTPKKSNSAPKELDLFARCCAATLRELIVNRGYDNIKHLTFYNEPDYGLNSPENGDFVVIGCDRKEYWQRMLRLTRDALNKNGLEHIKMWGCECSGSDEIMADWLDYFSENCRDVLDAHTIHRYQIDNDKCDIFLPDRVRHAGGIPIVLSECGQAGSDKNMSWKHNHIQLFSQVANYGFSGMLIWCINSVDITDPCSFTMRNEYDFWDTPHLDCGVNKVREAFYESAMLCRYVPNHCKVVKSEIIEGKNSLRVSAFKFQNDYTIVVETAGDITELEIKLPEAVNRKFYKHVHRRPHNYNGNATIPPRCGEVFVGDTLTDTVYPEYTAIVYTTLPAVPQVEASSTEIYIDAGERVRIPAAVIDGYGEVDSELSFATADCFRHSAADETVEALDNAKSGDMCAVTLRSRNHPQAENVVIVKVK